VATDKGVVIGCVVLVPLEATKAQLTQMAVAQELQGKGIGKLLVGELLRFCKTRNILEVICHARENAIPFYAGLGFEIYGDPFEEVGIPHRNMRISLSK
jgi:predicted GNAT family N-acyltransferase